MAATNDRRRINPPSGGTSAPVFKRTLTAPHHLESKRPSRTRGENELRKMFLQTTIIPTASGSAYLELLPPTATTTSSSLKLTASIQGPKPLPRSAPFSPSLHLSTTVKFAPFATRRRRGYLRDATERDLGVHLEAALRGAIIGERWPKSGVEVVVTVLEGEEDDGVLSGETGEEGAGAGAGWGTLNVLAGCVTVACAAIVDAGIDVVDLVGGGVAALVREPSSQSGAMRLVRVLDPALAEHGDVVAACVVAYLAGRDEITEVWLRGDVGAEPDALVEGAMFAAVGGLSVMREVLLESVEARLKGTEGEGEKEKEKEGAKRKVVDVEMTG